MSVPNSGNDLHKIVAETFLHVQQLRAEVQALRCELAGKATQSEGWGSPAAAAAALRSEGVKSPAHLKTLRLEGAFIEARSEIRNVSRGERPTWEYHIPKCRAALHRHFQRRNVD